MGPSFIQASANTLRILDIVSRHGSIRVGEAAAFLGVDRSNAYRLLKTMEHCGYLEFDEKCYTQGYKLDLMMSSGIDPVQMKLLAQPIMREVAAQTGEIVHLCMRIPRGMLFIHQEFSEQAIQVVKKDGAVEPIYCTASGRAALAFLSPRQQRLELESTTRCSYTDNTITDLDALLDQLRKVRERGFAEEVEEFNWGVRCIGVPIFNFRNVPTYSLGISSTTRGFQEQARNRWVGWLKAGARSISKLCADYEAGVLEERKTNKE